MLYQGGEALQCHRRDVLAHYSTCGYSEVSICYFCPGRCQLYGLDSCQHDLRLLYPAAQYYCTALPCLYYQLAVRAPVCSTDLDGVQLLGGDGINLHHITCEVLQHRGGGEGVPTRP